MKIKRVVHAQTRELYGWRFYCPGCKGPHVYGASWRFNGDMERPTFSPSLLVFTPEWTDTETGKKHPRETVCHLFLTDGVLRYCGDSPHELAGQSVPLPDLPEPWRD